MNERIQFHDKYLQLLILDGDICVRFLFIYFAKENCFCFSFCLTFMRSYTFLSATVFFHHLFLFHAAQCVYLQQHFSILYGGNIQALSSLSMSPCHSFLLLIFFRSDTVFFSSPCYWLKFPFLLWTFRSQLYVCFLDCSTAFFVTHIRRLTCIAAYLQYICICIAWKFASVISKL